MFIQKLYNFFSHKLFWLVPALTGTTMMAVALFYQYVLGDDPCQVCIHIRIWVIAFTLLSIIMLALPSKKLTSIIGNLVLVGMGGGLLERSLYLLKVEKGLGDSSCSFFLNFPDWIALDKWIPAIFEVRNLCTISPELIWGITMTDGLILISTLLIGYALAALALMLFYKPSQA